MTQRKQFRPPIPFKPKENKKFQEHRSLFSVEGTYENIDAAQVYGGPDPENPTEVVGVMTENGEVVLHATDLTTRSHTNNARQSPSEKPAVNTVNTASMIEF
eukprot:3328119-Amphidinium_carterae.1